MNLDFLTPQLFDLLIIVVIVLGLALAAVRLYDDLTRPLPSSRSPGADDDTQPHQALDAAPGPQGE
jgi:hypothetical protein